MPLRLIDTPTDPVARYWEARNRMAERLRTGMG